MMFASLRWCLGTLAMNRIELNLIVFVFDESPITIQDMQDGFSVIGFSGLIDLTTGRRTMTDIQA